MKHCPACYNEISQIIDGVCSNCAIEIERIVFNENGQKKRGIALTNDRSVYILDGEIGNRAISPGNNGVLISEGENPKIYLVNKTPLEFRIEWRHFVPTGWIYCPNCRKNMFWNMTSNLSGAQNYQCRHCKANLTYIFQSGLRNY